MAQYEATQEQIQQLTDGSTGLSDAVKDAIAAAVAGGGSVALLGSEGTTTETVSGTVPDPAVAASNVNLNNVNLSDAQAIAVDNSSGTLNANSSSAVTADLVNSSVDLNINNDAANNVSVSGATGGSVTAGNGNNSLSIADASNFTATLGNGNNNVDITGANGASGVNVFAGNGNNTMNIGSSETNATFNVSVETGDGNDAIALDGNVTGAITTGTGDLELTLTESAQEQAQISVDAGQGFDLLRLLGAAIKHAFEFVNGRFHMHSGDVAMTGVNVVATDVNSDGQIQEGVDHITVLAETEEDSLIAKLYKVALGREAIDGNDGWGDSTLGGFNWWTNEYEKTNDITDHEQLVRAFLNCEEFHTKYDAMTDTEYVNALFSNLGTSDVDLANTYINALKDGSMDRAEVAWNLAESAEAVTILGNDGEQYVIDGDFSANA